MATSMADIRGWLNEGKKKGATHTIVVVDTFDHEDYPVHVMPGQDVRTVYNEYNGKNMQRVMEVYALHEDLEKQLNTHRNFNFSLARQEEMTKKPDKVKEKLSSTEMHDVIHIVKNVKDKEQLQTLIKVAQKQLKEGK